MPQPTGNTMTLRIRQTQHADGSLHKCIAAEPLQLRVLRRDTNQIIIQPHPSNQEPVKLLFEQGPSAAVFSPVPPPVVNLLPQSVANASLNPPSQAQLILNIKTDLGIQLRGTFDDLNPSFVRTFILKTVPPERCGSGDAADVLIEC